MRNFGSVLRACAVGGMLLGISTSGVASTITYAFSDIDLGSGWRTPTVPKMGGIEVDNVLGVDGWIVAGASLDPSSPYVTIDTPSYLESLIPEDSYVYPGNPFYASIDNPETTPGPSPTTIESGTLNPFPGQGDPYTDVTFTFGATVPKEVEVGLMVDNLDIAAYNPSAVQLTQVGGGSSPVVYTTSAEYNDRIPDWLFFDIIQPQPGGTYDVIVYGGINGCACLGAVSFDSIPEPSSFGLAGVGAACLAAIALRRRHRRHAAR